jgi:UDP-glucose 4-epimerase
MVNKSVVVTGGAGFIGSHLADELAKRGYGVVILDDLSTGKTGNIVELIKKGNAEFIQGSITDFTLLQKIFKGALYVFHQAALASVPRSLVDPAKTNEVNITGTLNVLIAARDNNVKEVIYASSSSVYGDTPTLPKNEQMIPRPESPYAVTKLAGEYYCRVFQEIYGFKTACLRYFNVYGPRQDPGSEYAAVIPRFIQQVISNEAPVIFGDGEQTRDFTFIKDVVEANILAAETGASGIYNIGRGERITVNELAERIITVAGKDMEAIRREARAGDVKHSLADITAAESFGYQPGYSIEAGLKETFDWFLNE